MPASRLFGKLIPLVTITVLLLNLLAPVSIAFAQDADPPPEPPPAEEVAAEEPVEEEQPVEEGQEPLPEDEAPPAEEVTEELEAEEAEQANEPEAETDEEPLAEADGQEEAEEQPSEESQDAGEGEEAGDDTGDEISSLEENPIAEAVEALDEADAVLLDEEGEPLSMASQEAADTLAAPDPQFCPAGLSFGDAGCGASHASMADAIADALTAAGSGISGTIYVEAGSFSGFTLAGFTFGTSLTIQGNADNAGTTNFTGAGIADNTNTGLNLTFNDVTFDAGASINGVTGDLSFNDVIANNAGGNGISVNSQNGDVSLDNVTANNTGGTGADIVVNGNSTVTNSNFNGNSNQGLTISANDIVLNNVNANNNAGAAGADLGASGGSIQVSNSNFNNNTASGADGLIADGGVITLNGVTASGNDDTGIIATSQTDINLNNVTANNNGERGALLINDSFSLNDKSINVFNSNFDFNGNGSSTPQAIGLEINTLTSVTLDNVSASNNSGTNVQGAAIYKSGPFGDHLTITNSVFNNNGAFGFGDAHGLYIESSGSNTPGYAITLENVSASGNTSNLGDAHGAYINTGSLSVSDNDTPINVINSNFLNNTDNGLFIVSQGDVNLWGVNASGNGRLGVEVYIESSNGPHNTSIVCSSMQNNSSVGIGVDGQGGNLTILSTDTSGNSGGAVGTANVSNLFIGETDCNPSPGDDDDQRDGKHAPLDPNNPSTIVLDLYPHSVTFPPMNLLECEGYVKSLFFTSELPGDLNAGDTFLRALKMRIENCEIPAGGLFTIGFDIPATEQGNQFAVLFWDGATGSWIEVPGQMTGDGRYTVSWPTTGTFVLVTR